MASFACGTDEDDEDEFGKVEDYSGPSMIDTMASSATSDKIGTIVDTSSHAVGCELDEE